MKQEREYYLAGGEDLARAEDFLAKRDDGLDAMQALAQKHGGRAIHNGSVMIGLAFEGDEPAGWLHKGYCDGVPYYFPKQTNREARALVKELQSIRVGDAWAFHRLYCKDGGTRAGPGSMAGSSRILFMSCDRVGAALILSVPIGADFTPNGSRKLRMSEYWTMRETVETAEAMAPFDESASFICDAAMFHGFEYDDEAEAYRASEAALVAFVRAVREQGRQDAKAEKFAEATFLLDRLTDFEPELSEEQQREWSGHVLPSMARLAVLTEGAGQ